MPAAPAVFVLATGGGRRLWPFGVTTSKALLPVGPEPLLARTRRLLVGAGLETATVVAGGPHARAVQAFCATWPDLACASVAVAEGTAATLLAVAGDVAGPVLCLYGDTWLPAGALERLLGQAAADPGAAWLLVEPLGAERPGDWITVDVAGDGTIHGFAGHPRGGSHRPAGVFWLPEGFAVHLRANPGGGVRVPVGGMPHAEADLEESLNLFLRAGGRVRACPAEGAIDVDKPWHLLAANAAEVRERLAGAVGVRGEGGASVAASAEIRAPVVLEDGAEIGSRVVVRRPLYLCAGAAVTDGAIVAGPALLAPGARASDYARLGACVLGPGAVAGHCAEIEGLLMEGVYVVHYSEIYGVVGRHSDIGAATVCGTLRFDDGHSRQRVGGPGGRYEIPADFANASYIGDHARTGVNVTIQPGRSIGPYSCVGPGVLVTEDVPERTLVQLQQELQSRPWGPERYGW